MENQEDPKKGKKEGRSPGYPAIDLSSAIERARKLKEREQRHFAPIDAVVKHWGYSGKTGPFLGALSALIKFGLLEAQGSGGGRQFKITDLAWRILIDDREESPDRNNAIKEAALNPAMHRKLWERYRGELPSDETFRIHLLTDYGFTEGAVKDFISQFKRTITFANLDKRDILTGHEDDKNSIKEEHPMPPAPERIASQQPLASRTTGALGTAPTDVGVGTISFPLSATRWVKVELPYQLSEKEWEQIKNTLDVFKPGFMKETTEPNEGDN